MESQATLDTASLQNFTTIAQNMKSRVTLFLSAVDAMDRHLYDISTCKIWFAEARQSLFGFIVYITKFSLSRR